MRHDGADVAVVVADVGAAAGAVDQVVARDDEASAVELEHEAPVLRDRRERGDRALVDAELHTPGGVVGRRGEFLSADGRARRDDERIARGLLRDVPVRRERQAVGEDVARGVHVGERGVGARRRRALREHGRDDGVLDEVGRCERDGHVERNLRAGGGDDLRDRQSSGAAHRDGGGVLEADCVAGAGGGGGRRAVDAPAGGGGPARAACAGPHVVCRRRRRAWHHHAAAGVREAGRNREARGVVSRRAGEQHRPRVRAAGRRERGARAGRELEVREAARRRRAERDGRAVLHVEDARARGARLDDGRDRHAGGDLKAPGGVDRHVARAELVVRLNAHRALLDDSPARVLLQVARLSVLVGARHHERAGAGLANHAARVLYAHSAPHRDSLRHVDRDCLAVEVQTPVRRVAGVPDADEIKVVHGRDDRIAVEAEIIVLVAATDAARADIDVGDIAVCDVAADLADARGLDNAGGAAASEVAAAALDADGDLRRRLERAVDAYVAAVVADGDGGEARVAAVRDVEELARAAFGAGELLAIDLRPFGDPPLVAAVADVRHVPVSREGDHALERAGDVAAGDRALLGVGVCRRGAAGELHGGGLLDTVLVDELHRAVERRRSGSFVHHLADGERGRRPGGRRREAHRAGRVEADASHGRRRIDGDVRGGGDEQLVALRERAGGRWRPVGCCGEVSARPADPGVGAVGRARAGLERAGARTEYAAGDGVVERGDAVLHAGREVAHELAVLPDAAAVEARGGGPAGGSAVVAGEEI